MSKVKITQHVTVVKKGLLHKDIIKGQCFLNQHGCLFMVVGISKNTHFDKELINSYMYAMDLGNIEEMMNICRYGLLDDEFKGTLVESNLITK